MRHNRNPEGATDITVAPFSYTRHTPFIRPNHRTRNRLPCRPVSSPPRRYPIYPTARTTGHDTHRPAVAPPPLSPPSPSPHLLITAFAVAPPPLSDRTTGHDTRRPAVTPPPYPTEPPDTTPAGLPSPHPLIRPNHRTRHPPGGRHPTPLITAFAVTPPPLSPPSPRHPTNRHPVGEIQILDKIAKLVYSIYLECGHIYRAIATPPITLARRMGTKTNINKNTLRRECYITDCRRRQSAGHTGGHIISSS